LTSYSLVPFDSALIRGGEPESAASKSASENAFRFFALACAVALAPFPNRPGAAALLTSVPTTFLKDARLLSRAGFAGSSVELVASLRSTNSRCSALHRFCPATLRVNLLGPLRRHSGSEPGTGRHSHSLRLNDVHRAVHGVLRHPASWRSLACLAQFPPERDVHAHHRTDRPPVTSVRFCIQRFIAWRPDWSLLRLRIPVASCRTDSPYLRGFPK
jgi:hypothetical protein